MRTEPNKRKDVIYERIYEIILYEGEEDLLHKYLSELDKCKYAYILHDKDKKEDGEPKKKHLHLILWFDREKSINALSKEFGVPVNRIKWKADIFGTLQYLVHKNDSNKYQYDEKSIVSDIEGLHEYLYPVEKQKIDETDDLRLIMNYIQNHIESIRLYDIYRFCLDNGCWSSYRRNYSIIKDILIEERYIEKRRFTHMLYEDNKIDRKTGEVNII